MTADDADIGVVFIRLLWDISRMGKSCKKESLVIVDYRAGNLTSVKLALDAMGVRAEITDRPERILNADRVIFPGVGAAGAAIRTLGELGLVDVIRDVAGKGKPFLGICLGAQIIFERSDEDGGVQTLGLLKGSVRMFRPGDRADKVPHMGWNAVSQKRPHPIWNGIEDESEFYFVHSYYPAPSDIGLALGTTGYASVTFASVVGAANVVATQFHPEKSGRVGLRLLKNFVDWSPEL